MLRNSKFWDTLFSNGCYSLTNLDFNLKPKPDECQNAKSERSFLMPKATSDEFMFKDSRRPPVHAKTKMDFHANLKVSMHWPSEFGII